DPKQTSAGSKSRSAVAAAAPRWLSAAHCRPQGDDPADLERLHGWIIRKTYGNAGLIYGNVHLIPALLARAPPWRSIMKKLIAILTIVALMAVPTFVQSATAAPVSPSSSAFGGNGYCRFGLLRFAVELSEPH